MVMSLSTLRPSLWQSNKYSSYLIWILSSHPQSIRDCSLASKISLPLAHKFIPCMRHWYFQGTSWRIKPKRASNSWGVSHSNFNKYSPWASNAYFREYTTHFQVLIISLGSSFLRFRTPLSLNHYQCFVSPCSWISHTSAAYIQHFLFVFARRDYQSKIQRIQKFHN